MTCNTKVLAVVLVALAVEGGSGDNPISSSYALSFLVILAQRGEYVEEYEKGIDHLCQEGGALVDPPLFSFWNAKNNNNKKVAVVVTLLLSLHHLLIRTLILLVSRRGR